MHLCYLDDSGDSRHGVTITALIIEDRNWSSTLDAWLEGRRAIHREFGVLKHSEVHASALYKGRGRYCADETEGKKFGRSKRDAVGRILLSSLSAADFTVMTFATSEVSKPIAYAQSIARLEDWAAKRDTFLMIFYDGQQGLSSGDQEVTTEQSRELWERAVRDATPYREAHRSLSIGDRRILEDPVMQDSKYSQLIQAADLIAYGAYHSHKQDHPEIWGDQSRVMPAAIIAYRKVAAHWPTDSDRGVIWLER
ncbi:DUF3800 domain-containing protein [Microbacterium sp. TNHR37B]|uniref:DUF3800 domain-containing protein n=1 Tax=Microbacterium sp. TNHR37B TaxID=1775956 RepID=UPI0007B2ADC0|nr:DUF3800 domain-containing protein [Microbacterium sp. TNHR37B]KZE88432.1 hypothetical protein AVP41_02936 [Microbacterium sp. TNHR37B]